MEFLLSQEILQGFKINSSQLCEILSMLHIIFSEVVFIDLMASEAANTSLYLSLIEKNNV